MELHLVKITQQAKVSNVNRIEVNNFELNKNSYKENFKKLLQKELFHRVQNDMPITNQTRIRLDQSNSDYSIYFTGEGSFENYVSTFCCMKSSESRYIPIKGQLQIVDADDQTILDIRCQFSNGSINLDDLDHQIETNENDLYPNLKYQEYVNLSQMQNDQIEVEQFKNIPETYSYFKAAKLVDQSEFQKTNAVSSNEHGVKDDFQTNYDSTVDEIKSQLGEAANIDQLVDLSTQKIFYKEMIPYLLSVNVSKEAIINAINKNPLRETETVTLLQEGLNVPATALLVFPFLFSEKKNTIMPMSDQISALLSYVECFQTVDLLSPKDVLQNSEKKTVIMLGNTGSGKSTTINYLLGHQYYQKEASALDLFLCNPNHPYLAEVGHGLTSKTFKPSLFPYEPSVYLSDLPGFLDSRSASINIANICNTQHLLNKFDNLKILIVINGSSHASDRGYSLKQLSKTLIDMFGDTKKIEEYSSSILIGWTHLPKADSLSCIKNDIEEFEDQFEGLQPCINRMIQINPMISNELLLNQIFNMPWMQKGTSEVFKISLNDSDKVFLTGFFDHALETINNALETQAFDQVKESLEILNQLKKIPHKFIKEKIEGISKKVEEYFSEQMSNVEQYFLKTKANQERVHRAYYENIVEEVAKAVESGIMEESAVQNFVEMVEKHEEEDQAIAAKSIEESINVLSRQFYAACRIDLDNDIFYKYLKHNPSSIDISDTDGFFEVLDSLENPLILHHIQTFFDEIDKELNYQKSGYCYQKPLEKAYTKELKELLKQKYSELYKRAVLMNGEKTVKECLDSLRAKQDECVTEHVNWLMGQANDTWVPFSFETHPDIIASTLHILQETHDDCHSLAGYPYQHIEKEYQGLFRSINETAKKKYNQNKATLLKNYIVDQFKSEYLPKHNQSTVKNITSKLVQLKTFDATTYEQTCQQIEAVLQPYTEPSALESKVEHYYYQKAAQQLSVVGILRGLEPHIKIEEKWKDLSATVLKRLNSEYNNLKIEIARTDEINPTSPEPVLKSFQHYVNLFDSLESFHFNMPSSKEELMLMVERQWEKNKEIYKKSHSFETLAFHILYIQTMFSCLGKTAQGKSKIKDAFQLKEVKSHLFGIQERLMSYENHPTLGLALKELRDSLPGLDPLAIEDFNLKMNKLNIEEDINKLYSNDNTLNKSNLIAICTFIKQRYQQYVKNFIAEKDAFEIDAYIEDCKILGKNIQSTKGYHVENAKELLAKLFGLMTYLKYKEHNFDSRESQFFTPHHNQILSTLLMTGFVDDNKHPESCKQLKNKLLQVNTGEGKSIALGISSAMLALMEYDVSCVCYNDYLSNRDKKAFEKVFSRLKVKKHISYMTIGTLCNNIMQSDIGDLRQATQSLIQGKPIEWEESTQLEAQLMELNTPNNKKRPRILLIDEVDVFFGKDFYGELYNPIIHIHHQYIENLSNYIWENRDQKLTLSDVIGKSIGQNDFKKEYPNFTEAMLNEKIKEMIRDVQCFPKGKEPTHECICKDDKIGYENSNTGNISYNIYDGYKTLFAYFHYHEKEQITANKRNGEIRIGTSVGGVLYSELPKFFEVKIGITGSLDELTSFEKNILNSYGLNSHVFVPSIFPKRKIIIEETEVCLVKDKYFPTIRNNAKEKINQDRACLIFFETNENLKSFHKFLQNQEAITSKKILILNDSLTTQERENVISQSTLHGRITLCTRAYGRGTDFICRDSYLIEKGGVHVIQTFYAPTASEEKQLKGRTGRQDDPGSYKQILLMNDLSDRFSVSTDAEKKEKSWDVYLNEKRSTYAEMISNSITSSLKRNTERYHRTLQYINQMKNENYQEAIKLLEKINGIDLASQDEEIL